MRVISGTKKGHRLKAPSGLETRPTQDRVKESLFNILGNIDSDSLVLDLFSGSGSIGIEFLSRGAKECYFIDNFYKSVRIIKDNLLFTKLDDKAHVYKNDVMRAIDILGKKKLLFNFIFMDPPYRKNMILNVLKCISTNNILNCGGIIIIEHESELILDKNIFKFLKIDERNYRDKVLTFYKTTDKLRR